LLSVNGHQVQVFAPLHINKYLSNLPPGTINGQIRRRLPPASTPMFRFLNTVVARPKIRAWNPDIIHETYFSPISTGPKGIPPIITVYDMIHERFPKEFWPWDRTSNNKKLAVERASHVICISESTRRDLLEILGTQPEKVTTIHLAYEEYTPAYFHQFAVPNPSTPLPFILYVGNRNGYKNFNRLLEAFATSPELYTQFDIVCFGGEKLNAKEYRFIKRLKMENHIRYFSGTDQILGQLYRKASVFVCSSLYEGFGLPSLEAMAHGCPVVASNTSSLPEIIGNAGAFFDPVDTGSIRETLRAVLFSDAMRKELINKGYMRLSHFSWKKCAEQTLEVYRQFV
jgi:glycosyltransferase involved in cell wall biosynthesis